MRYLDPKNDLTFKKIFGENPDLAISFLNALMPFEEDQYIEKLEYLSPELVPELPVFKHTIVDVRCIDNKGRQFIIEMQMLWTDSFKTRVMFNASKAYVTQLERGKKFNALCPVYSLNLINDTYLKDDPDFYHHYSIVNIENTDEKIEGLEFIFIELPKFKPETMLEKRMAVLWLRFLTEFDDTYPAIIENPEAEEIKKAVKILEESSYSKNELRAYSQYWDAIMVTQAYKYDALEKGMKEGRKEGREEGREEGRLEGHKEGLVEGKKQGIRDSLSNVVINMEEKGYTLDDIEDVTGLSFEEIKTILKSQLNE